MTTGAGPNRGLDAPANRLALERQPNTLGGVGLPVGRRHPMWPYAATGVILAGLALVLLVGRLA